MFTREILSRDEIIPVYYEMSVTVYTFLPRWNFIPGWTHPCQKDRDEISSRDEKKKKRRVNTSSRDEILKSVCFFNFWHMYFNMLSKVSISEHIDSMNIMKHKASLWKKRSPKRKRMSTISTKSKMQKHFCYFYYFLCET